MKTKEKLLKEIDNIPEFVFRQVALADPSGPPSPIGAADTNLALIPQYKECSWNEVRAITEANNTKPITFVSNRYNLVQFKNVFKPLVQEHTECEGKLCYSQGFAILDIYPTGNDFLLSDGSRIGLSAYNSVNRTSALIIRFSIHDGSRTITFPKDISSYYKTHVGKTEEKAQNYIEMINKIKDTWATIINDFSNINVSLELFDSLTKNLKTDPRILKVIKNDISSGTVYNMWDMVMKIYDEMEKKYAKTDIHKRKRLDNFVDSITKWGFLLKL